MSIGYLKKRSQRIKGDLPSANRYRDAWERDFVRRLLYALEIYQSELNVSDAAFARLIGISRVHWWDVRNGKSSIGGKMLCLIKQQFPQLYESCY